MNPEQEADFRTYGCTSASIVRMLEARGKPLTTDEFVDRFNHHFLDGKTGLLSLDGICAVIKELGIHDAVYSVRDPSVAKKVFSDGENADVLVLTDLAINSETGLKSSLYHCCLALGWKDSGNIKTDEVFLFYPFQDTAPEEVWHSFRFLEERLVHFLILS